MDRIDILMATYNGEHFVSEQIDSILKQTYTEFRLFICDDMSTDKTVSIINKYQENHPDRIKIVLAKQKYGANQCFSYLLTHADSDYIMFADQDDVWNQEKLKLTLEGMKKEESINGKEEPILVHSDLVVVDHNLNMLCNSFWKYAHLFPKLGSHLNRLLLQNVVTGCTAMINRAALLRITPVPEKVVQHDWWAALVVAATGHIKYIDQALTYYRQHSSNVIGANKFSYSKQLRWIFKSIDVDTTYKIKHRNQAVELLNRVGATLNFDKKKMLKAFISLDELTFFQSVKTCIRYRFYFHGYTRNLSILAKQLKKRVLNKVQ